MPKPHQELELFNQNHLYKIHYPRHILVEWSTEVCTESTYPYMYILFIDISMLEFGKYDDMNAWLSSFTMGFLQWTLHTEPQDSPTVCWQSLGFHIQLTKVQYFHWVGDTSNQNITQNLSIFENTIKIFPRKQCKQYIISVRMQLDVWEKRLDVF